MASTNNLEPISPADAVEWYLNHRRDDVRTATLRKQDSAIGTLVDWTEEVAIANMNDVRGRQLMRFKTWRKNETDVNTVSLNGNLAILRRFFVLHSSVYKSLISRVERQGFNGSVGRCTMDVKPPTNKTVFDRRRGVRILDVSD